jgi:hypothetical protein
MTMRCAVALLALAVASQVQAQQLVRTFEQDTGRVITRHPVIRVGKWVTLGAAAGAAAYGIMANRDADRRYESLERLCETTPARCARRFENGPFIDSALESEYQDILDLDGRAKLALLVGEVSVAASVALFILDLPRRHKGEDIPYKPPRLELNVDPVGRLNIQVNYRN